MGDPRQGALDGPSDGAGPGTDLRTGLPAAGVRRQLILESDAKAPQLDFGIALDDQAEPATPKPILPPDPLRNSRNFRLNNDVASHIAEGGSKARIQNNLDILELLKSIQAEQRTATTDEQNRIAKYIDFGGLRELWDQGYRYYEERNRLAEILTEDEIDAVKETSLNTCLLYTSRCV